MVVVVVVVVVVGVFLDVVSVAGVPLKARRVCGQFQGTMRDECMQRSTEHLSITRSYRNGTRRAQQTRART